LKILAELNLGWDEVLEAALVGVMRQIEQMKKEASHAHGADEETSWQMHIVGAIGEKVLAKHKNLYWSKGKVRDLDVGPYQVRAAVEHYKRLILHPTDEDHHRFYFVTGSGREYRIRGWIQCGDGKRQEYWQDPTKKNRYAFFVPTDKLHEVDTDE